MMTIPRSTPSDLTFAAVNYLCFLWKPVQIFAVLVSTAYSHEYD